MRFWFWRRRGRTELPAPTPPDAQRLLFGAAPDAAARPPAAKSPDPGPAPSPTALPLDPQLDAAAALVAKGLVDGGLAAYERIAAADAGCAEAWFRIGILRQDFGDGPGALQAWERAVSCEPTHWLASLRLATALDGMGYTLRAAGFLIQARDQAPQLGEIAIHLSGVYARLGWLDKASEVLAQLERPLPGWWEQAARNVEKMAATSATQLAALEQQAAESGSPTEAVRLKIASILRVIGRLAESEAMLRAHLVARPEQWPAHGELSALLERSQGQAAAIDYLRTLGDPVSSDPAYQLALAWLLHGVADSRGALRLLAGLLARQQPAPAICRACAIMALAAGEDATFEQAVRAWVAVGEVDSWAARFAIASARRRRLVARFGEAGAEKGGALAPEPAAPMQPEPAAPMPPEPAAPMPIIQFWGQLPPPEDVAETMRSWHLQNPTLPHITFDSAGARNFIADQAGQVVAECFDSARHPAMQADIFRLVFLAKYGGIYVDADEICLRPIDDFLRAMRRVKLAAWLSAEVTAYVNNAFLAAHPGCPIIGEALAESVRILTGHLGDGTRPDIWQVTGPGLITRAIGRHVLQPERAGEVLLLTDQEYRSFAHTVELAYKQTNAGNWRLH